MKQAVKTVLAAAGLLDAVRATRALWHRARQRAGRERYYRRLVDVYRDPETRYLESYEAFVRRELDAAAATALARFAADAGVVLQAVLRRLGVACMGAQDSEVAGRFLRAVEARYSATADKACLASVVRAMVGGTDSEPIEALGAPMAELVGVLPSAVPALDASDDRLALVRAVLDRLVGDGQVPKFYDYDHIEDIRGIIGGRYCADRGPHPELAERMERALLALSAADPSSDLPSALRKLLGAEHGYLPRRGDVTSHVRNTIPDLADEFIVLRAERNPRRFLDINREYSRRQATAQGLWDNRQLSLLRGYERDHHAMLRALIGLIRDGEIRREDEVLLVGPRHVDEIAFFRRHLGLPRTFGLDLFPYGKDEILAGDMHDMPFDAGRFKLVYCAGTLSYAYNARKVLDEMARVLDRPGFLFLVDAAGRHAGPDALGRSDVAGVDVLVGMLHRHPFDVLVKDAGRSLAPEMYANEPCLAVRLKGAPHRQAPC
jgi:SAM-dependent methyltransferase